MQYEIVFTDAKTKMTHTHLVTKVIVKENGRQDKEKLAFTGSRIIDEIHAQYNVD